MKMIDWQWKKKARLSEQLKFFGAKKQKFISVYAKKPKVRIKVKTASVKCNENNRDYLICQGDALYQRQMQGNQAAALYQQQMQLGIQRSAFGCNQMAAAQQGIYGGQGGSGLHHMPLSGMIGGRLYEYR